MQCLFLVVDYIYAGVVIGPRMGEAKPRGLGRWASCESQGACWSGVPLSPFSVVLVFKPEIQGWSLERSYLIMHDDEGLGRFCPHVSGEGSP